MMIAGLVYYGINSVRLEHLSNRDSANRYLNSLYETIEKEAHAKATSSDVLQFFECDFLSVNNQKHPINVIEMSGEVFCQFEDNSAIPNNRTEIPPLINELLSNNNKKIFVLVVDYAGIVYDFHDIRQKNILISSLRTLEQNGVLEKINAIKIVISKWDLNPIGSKTEASKILQKTGYEQLQNLCDEYAKEYGFTFSFDTFSLGNFYGYNNRRYNFDKTDTKKLFDWCTELDFGQK